MKLLPLFLFIPALAVGNACADPMNLCGGAMITHYVPDLQLSDLGDPCEAYAPYAITHHSQQLNRIDVADTLFAAWYIIAAWAEEKEFCGAQFGWNDYDPSLFYYTGCCPCFPPTGGLWIAGHPGPGNGITIVTVGDPWRGTYVPIFFNAGYTYGDVDPGIIQLVPDPTVVSPFAGFANCGSPADKWDAVLGGIGINMDGTYAEPVAASPVDDTHWGRIKAIYR